METQWAEIFRSAGPVVAAIAFFVWRDWKRESSMTERIRALEDFQRDQLAGMVHDAIAVQTRTNEVMNRVELALTRCTERGGV